MTKHEAQTAATALGAAVPTARRAPAPRYTIFILYRRADRAVGCVEASAATLREARERTAYLAGFYGGQGHTVEQATIRRGGTLLARLTPQHGTPQLSLWHPVDAHAIVDPATIERQRRAFADLAAGSAD